MSIALHYDRSGIHKGEHGAWFIGHVYGQKRERHKFLSYGQINDMIQSGTKRPSDIHEVDALIRNGETIAKFTIHHGQILQAVKAVEKGSKKLCEKFDRAAPNYSQPMKLQVIYNHASPLMVFTNGQDRAMTLTETQLEDLLTPSRRDGFYAECSDAELFEARARLKDFKSLPQPSASREITSYVQPSPIFAPNRHHR